MSRRVIPGLEAPDVTLETEIRGRLDLVERALEKSVHVESSGLLTETSSYLIAAGGKRFRAMLVLLAGYLGDPYHDDVIDESDARRGEPSANVRWTNTVAILTGDFLFARASEISTELGTDICQLLARTIAILCDGQIREVDSSAKVDQPESNYQEIIRRKTASLIATSCRLGGMLSDATPEHTDTIERFGDALGMAFQLSDDIMDITSSQLELGKEPGSDMRMGVYTAPVLHALAHGDRRQELARLLQHGAPEGERLDQALEIIRAEGSIEHARRAVTAEVVRAKTLARSLPESRARSALIQLASFLAARCGAEQGA